MSFPEVLPTLREASLLLIQEALERTGGNISAAARLLGVTQSALSKRLSRTGAGLRTPQRREYDAGLRTTSRREYDAGLSTTSRREYDAGLSTTSRREYDAGGELDQEIDV